VIEYPLDVHKILCLSNRARFPLKARGADMRARRHGTTLSSLRSLFGSPYNRLLVLPSRRDSSPSPPSPLLRVYRLTHFVPLLPPLKIIHRANDASERRVVGKTRSRHCSRARVSAVLKILAAARRILEIIARSSPTGD